MADFMTDLIRGDVQRTDDPGHIETWHAAEHRPCGWSGDLRETREDAQGDLDQHLSESCCPAHGGGHEWRAESAAAKYGDGYLGAVPVNKLGEEKRPIKWELIKKCLCGRVQTTETDANMVVTKIEYSDGD